MTKEEYIKRRKNGESKESIIASWQAERQKKDDELTKSTGASNEEWTKYAQYLAGAEGKGSGSAYYRALMESAERDANKAANKAATEYGLEPGSNAYAMFVSEYSKRLLQNDTNYSGFSELMNMEHEKEEAERLKQRSIQERQFADQYGKYMSENVDPTTGMLYSDEKQQAEQSIQDVKNLFGRNSLQSDLGSISNSLRGAARAKQQGIGESNGKYTGVAVKQPAKVV